MNSFCPLCFSSWIIVHLLLNTQQQQQTISGKYTIAPNLWICWPLQSLTFSKHKNYLMVLICNYNDNIALWHIVTNKRDLTTCRSGDSCSNRCLREQLLTGNVRIPIYQSQVNIVLQNSKWQVVSWPHGLMKSSSEQLKCCDLHLKWRHCQTNTNTWQNQYVLITKGLEDQFTE